APPASPHPGAPAPAEDLPEGVSSSGSAGAPPGAGHAAVRIRARRGPARPEAYLRSVVCNLTRMRIRHLQVARKHMEPQPSEPVASAEISALLRDDQRVLIDALQRLPARQREALVLRHWLGLKESEIAAAMGISAGSVKTHTSRGIAALTQAMEARR
ncbi:sigma-70 family RNA polymerase sigma factor, partial [Streptomyces chitinivorans]